MNNLQRMAKAKTQLNKYQVLPRVKIGRALFVYASLPLCSFWAYAFAIPLMCPLSPSMWAKDKVRYWKDGRTL